MRIQKYGGAEGASLWYNVFTDGRSAYETRRQIPVLTNKGNPMMMVFWRESLQERKAWKSLYVIYGVWGVMVRLPWGDDTHHFSLFLGGASWFFPTQIEVDIRNVFKRQNHPRPPFSPRQDWCVHFSYISDYHFSSRFLLGDSYNTNNTKKEDNLIEKKR